MGLSTIFTVTSLFAFATAQYNATSQANATVCVSGAHIIVARASLEDPGYGTLGTVKDNLLARIPNSNAIAVPYPATIWGPVVYVDSEPEGVGNMTLLVKDYVDACPGHKIVLMGYSQGAHVVGDTLIGADYTAFGSFPKTNGLDQKYLDSVAAVIMMGDPANVAGEPFLRGNSTHSGNFPRNNTAAWVSKGLVDRMLSYCDANDTFCDSGSDIPIHLSYVSRWGSQAEDFVVQKFATANTSASATSSSASSTGSSKPTSSATSTSSSHRATSGASLYTVFGVQGILVIALMLAV